MPILCRCTHNQSLVAGNRPASILSHPLLIVPPDEGSSVLEGHLKVTFKPEKAVLEECRYASCLEHAVCPLSNALEARWLCCQADCLAWPETHQLRRWMVSALLPTTLLAAGPPELCPFNNAVLTLPPSLQEGAGQPCRQPAKLPGPSRCNNAGLSQLVPEAAAAGGNAQGDPAPAVLSDSTLPARQGHDACPGPD